MNVSRLTSFVVSGLIISLSQGYAQESSFSERGMNIHYFDIPSGTDSVKVDDKKVKAFGSRKDAINFFTAMTIKSDMITVAVDSASVSGTLPELYIIREEHFIRP